MSWFKRLNAEWCIYESQGYVDLVTGGNVFAVFNKWLGEFYFMNREVVPPKTVYIAYQMYCLKDKMRV